jgi:hypothetical protein
LSLRGTGRYRSQLPAIGVGVTQEASQTTMEIIDRIKVALAESPGLRFSETSGSIEVHPRDEHGFTVGLQVEPGGFRVHFDGWHEDFHSAEEAVNCFLFGLTPSCRLAVVYRGRMATTWRLEGQRDGEWTTDSETVLLLQPFWRRPRIVYRQNRNRIAG